jgi:hypothetical protein
MSGQVNRALACVTNGLSGRLRCCDVESWCPAMKDFVFKVNLVAVVRVRADDESLARKVVPTVLGAPGVVGIRLAMRTMLRRAVAQR